MNDNQFDLGNRTHPGSAADDIMNQQQDWLRVTLSSIGDAVITTDNNSDVTFLNPIAQSLTGWTQADAEGKPLDAVFQIVNEVTRQTVENPAMRALQDGVIVGLANHTMLITKLGKEWPIDDSAAPIRNAAGEVAGAVLVFREVTERKRQEQQVLDALDYVDNIIATLREPFLVLDKELRVVTANRAFYDRFQVSLAETQGRFIYEMGNRQWDIPKLQTLLADVLPQDHTFQSFAVEHDFPNIGRKVMLLNARRIRQSGNDAVLILLAIEDVTEQRQTQRLLNVSEVRYRRLFEAAKDGILILDSLTGRIIDANPFMSEILGYSHSEFIGKELWEIGLFSDKSASESVVRELQQKGYVRFEHLPLESKHGRRVEVEVVANVYQEDQHSVIQCNIRDITERSRLESLLRDQAAEVSDLHRRKDEFLAMLSHELRSPLAPIANAVQLLSLQRDGESRTQQQARGIIERQLGQLQHLVDDLLEVSRITSGRIQLRQERVAVSRIVEGAVETVRPLLEQRGHELTVTLPPEPIWLNADVSRLEQVLVNLLTNAAKFTDEGGHVWLTVETEEAGCESLEPRPLGSGVFKDLQPLPDGRGSISSQPLRMPTTEVVIRVRDTGVGIAPALLPRIFDLFTQGERSLDRAQGGLGIGLALVHRLTELHGGKVEVSSTLGKGSEFVVRLPVASTDSPPPTLTVPEDGYASPRPLRVLVVDDNVDTVLSFSMLLRASGHEVRTAHDGPTAVQAAHDYQPDAVMLDIGLPGLNGYEVAKRIRQDPLLKNIVLIAVTGYGQEGDRLTSLQAGFNHHLVKPARLAQLKEILATVAVSGMALATGVATPI